jgi:intracellular septation protein
MKVLYDYIAIIAFFVAYKLYGIYTATVVAIAVAALQTIMFRLIYKRFEKFHVITFCLLAVLGGATLLFHNTLFIKWKPSVIYWLFAVIMIFSMRKGSKPVLQRLLEDKISLPDRIWRTLNQSWAYYFTGLGLLNVYVLTYYSTDAWVNFKLFGTLGLTLVFTIGQAIYMSKHMQHVVAKDTKPAANDKTLSDQDKK